MRFRRHRSPDASLALALTLLGGVAIAVTLAVLSVRPADAAKKEEGFRGRSASFWYHRAVLRREQRDHLQMLLVDKVRMVGRLQRLLVSPRLSTPSVYAIAHSEAARQGVTEAQWLGCLVPLISRENAESTATWNPYKANGRGSGAYGLPQALPGSKMGSEGSDWFWNPATQVRWMIHYARSRYGGVCEADAFQRRNNYY